ncbi:MAG: ribbon-helix-helix domain-containing protein [Planctomycetota bacterium]
MATLVILCVLRTEQPSTSARMTETALSISSRITPSGDSLAGLNDFLQASHRNRWVPALVKPILRDGIEQFGHSTVRSSISVANRENGSCERRHSVIHRIVLDPVSPPSESGFSFGLAVHVWNGKLIQIGCQLVRFTFSGNVQMPKKQRGGARPGSGRKAIHPEGATITVAAKTPLALVERLDVVAERKGWKRSEAITEAIRVLLKKHEPKAAAPSS